MKLIRRLTFVATFCLVYYLGQLGEAAGTRRRGATKLTTLLSRLPIFSGWKLCERLHGPVPRRLLQSLVRSVRSL